MSNREIEREAGLVQSWGYCLWCKKTVPSSPQNISQHCRGSSHRQAVRSWVDQDVDAIERNGWRCQLCEIKVTGHRSVATAHVTGRNHYAKASGNLVNAYLCGADRAQSSQPSQSHQQPESTIDPEILQIVRDGHCPTCRTQISQHLNVATEHVKGRPHKLHKTLKQADWKNGIEELQKSAEGLEVSIIIDDEIQPNNQPIVVELNTRLEFALELQNSSGRSHLLRRLLVMPPDRADHIGMNLSSNAQATLFRGKGLRMRHDIFVKDLDRVGQYELLFAFIFAKALLLHKLSLTVGSREISEQRAAAAAKPYVRPKKRSPAEAHRLAQKLKAGVVVPGEKLTRETNAQQLYVRQLPYFDLPNPLPPRAAFLQDLQPPLSSDTYKTRFSTLLQLEEFQMCVDILGYDRMSSFSTAARYPNLLRLQVDGLSESRPSVQMGDSIWASLTPIGENSRPKGVFEGCVHHVEKDYVFLKFNAGFHANHITGTNYHIRFRFNRIPIRRMHQGICDLVANGAHTRLLMDGNNNTTRSFSRVIQRVGLEDPTLVNGYGWALRLHDTIDCLDTEQRWCFAQVVDQTREKVLVHYVDWSSKWDAWFDRSNKSLQPPRTKTKGYTGPVKRQGSDMTSASSSSSSPIKWSGPSLFVTDKPQDCDEWIKKEVFSKKVTHVGLDTESQPIFRAPNQLALVQVATRTAVLIYRIFRTTRLPDTLEQLLASLDILKFSIGDEKDLLVLLHNSHIVPNSLHNLQDHKLGGLMPDGKLKSTETLANQFCPQLKFKKNTDVTVSDWGIQWPLKLEQQLYAANDALIAYAIAEAIIAPRSGQPPNLPVSLISYTISSLAVTSAPSSSSSSSMSIVSGAQPIASPEFRRLNEIQRNTVVKILEGKYHPRPFLLFGPPGTGKTTVLVEAIAQLLHPSNSSSNRILAVAPSNSAADLFVERLKHLSKLEMFRLNAISRVVSTTPEKVKEYSKIVGDGFVLIDRPSVLKYRLIVTTAMSASCLSGVGCEPGDFTHIIFDEAGHATEPESLAAIGGLVDLNKTRIVLGGDPKQLGPVVRSPDAIKGGLGISLLERLMQPYLDDNDEDEDGGGNSSGGGGHGDQFMTKLLHNYRSHPQILAAPNTLFYKNELLASAEEIARRSLCGWPEFPNQNDFPLLFHHLHGKEQQEASSPSWFNLDEADLIRTYVTKLFEYKRAGLSAKDIGIITPYHRQVTHIRAFMKSCFEALGRQDWVDLKVGSCEEFQGQERRVILISTVRSQTVSLESWDVKFQLGFVQQPKRMNVAITRAKQALIIVGNGDVLKTDPHWRTLLRHCQQNQAFRGIPLKLGSTDSTGGSSTSSSHIPPDDDEDVSALEQFVAMKEAAEAKDDQEDQIEAGRSEDDADDDWTVVPSGDQPWKPLE